MDERRCDRYETIYLYMDEIIITGYPGGKSY